MPQSDFTVEYSDVDRSSKVEECLKQYGVAIVSGVYEDSYCDELMDRTVSAMKVISPELKTDSIKDLEETWIESHLMPQTRAGLHQRGYQFLAWNIRADPKLTELFKSAYSGLRGHPVTETVTSLDAINIKPPIAPFDDGRDWAHLDQTEIPNIFECIQGQVVISNTSAGFRCSPKSHLCFNDILKENKKLGAKGNWFMIPKNKYKYYQKIIENKGGEWQTPIRVPKGSVIFWLSSTIHSAILPSETERIQEINPENPWDQWRGVFYVCHRPKEEVTPDHIGILNKAFKLNLTTNHWGNKVFPAVPARFKRDQYSKRIQRFVKDPERILTLEGIETVEETPEISALLGK